MKTVFVSDGHLKGRDDPNQKRLVGFLDSLDKVDTLVILGDLFDFWTGANSVVEKNYRPSLDALLRLKRRGARIVYLEGNHDFSMGPFFTGTLSAEVHSESREMTIGGKRFLLAHGDTVSMKLGYRLWRAFLRSPFFRLAAAIATPPIVWKIANILSERSRKRGYSEKENSTEKALRGFAEESIARGLDGVILGHSHEAGINSIEAGGRSGIYANPGSFGRNSTFLVHDERGFRIERFSHGDTL